MTNHAHTENAVLRKQKYPFLDAVVSDGALRRSFRKLPKTEMVTLQSLLTEDYPAPPSPSAQLKALDLMLQNLLKNGAVVRRHDLASKLLSAGDFLNTLSELGLATYFFENGWTVRLEEPIPTGSKNSDIYVRKSGTGHYVEVINLAHKRLPQKEVLFGSVTSPQKDEKLVEKIIDKYRGKFEVALKNGWEAKTWIAIDYTKDDLANITAASRDRFVPQWLHNIAPHIKGACSLLSGIITYRYMPHTVQAQTVTWEYLE